MDFLDRFFSWMSRPGDTLVPRDELPGSPEALLATLGEQYGIEIDWRSRTANGSITHASSGAGSLADVYKLLQSELSIYSIPMIKNSWLQRIVLCRDLRADTHVVGGLMVSEKGELYLDVQSIHSWHPTRRALHHEIFHCIDFHDDENRYADPQWSKLNERNFIYSRDLFQKRKGKFVNRIGFMTNYAMTAVHEDKAELYSHMVIHYNCVEARMQTDPILNEKGARMRRLLRGFCRDFDYNFWNARKLASTPMEDEVDAEVVKLKISKEMAKGKEVWFVERQNLAGSKPIVFYSRETLLEFFQQLDLIDFQEIEHFHGGMGNLELFARTPKEHLPEAWLRWK